MLEKPLRLRNCFNNYQRKCKYAEVFLIFASSRTMPGHVREFNRLKQHSSHDLVFKMSRNYNTEATLRVFFVSD